MARDAVVDSSNVHRKNSVNRRSNKAGGAGGMFAEHCFIMTVS